MRLYRPYTPFAIRLAVVLRQLGVDAAIAAAKVKSSVEAGTLEADFAASLYLLALAQKVMIAELELHHRPGLLNRRKYKRNGKTVYEPDANDPDHLFYLPRGDHDVETRVRGLHGQHSDLGLARKLKRIAKNRDPNRRTAKIAQPKNRKWPSRPFNRGQ